MRQIKNIRHQLPPVMIFQPVCTLDVYVCVERACLLIDMTSYKDAETPFLRICLRLEAEEFNRTVPREIFLAKKKVIIFYELKSFDSKFSTISTALIDRQRKSLTRGYPWSFENDIPPNARNRCGPLARMRTCLTSHSTLR